MNCRKRGVRNLRLGHRWVGLVTRNDPGTSVNFGLS